MTKRQHIPAYPAELRERGVRLFRENRVNYSSDSAAYKAIAPKLGCSPDSLRVWCQQAERDDGQRAGPEPRFRRVQDQSGPLGLFDPCHAQFRQLRACQMHRPEEARGHHQSDACQHHRRYQPGRDRQPKADRSQPRLEYARRLGLKAARIARNGMLRGAHNVLQIDPEAFQLGRDRGDVFPPDLVELRVQLLAQPCRLACPVRKNC